MTRTRLVLLGLVSLVLGTAEGLHAQDAASSSTRFRASAVVLPLQQKSDGRYGLRAEARALADGAAPRSKHVAGEACAQALGSIFANGFEDLPGGLHPRGAMLALNLIGGCWSSTGDAGSDATLQFLGTLDAQPLVLRARNARVARLEPSLDVVGSVPISANVILGSAMNLVGTGVYGAGIGGGGVPAGDSDPLLSDEGPNRVLDAFGSVAGGYDNQAGDGVGNLYDRALSRVGGGRGNRADGGRSTVLGGTGNLASGHHSAIAGGSDHIASGSRAFVGGGLSNSSSAGVTLGGSSNQNMSAAVGNDVGGGSIGGGSSNAIGLVGGRIGGGSGNLVDAGSSVVLGGLLNSIEASASTVLGGRSHAISESAPHSTAAGERSIIAAPLATTAGYLSQVMGEGNAILAGYSNVAEGSFGVILSGESNVTAGQGAVAAGLRACAQADWSFAGGRSVSIRGEGQADSSCAVPAEQGHAGTFVWGGAENVTHSSTGPNQFLVFGSVGVDSNNPLGNALRVNGTLALSLGSSASSRLCRNADLQLASCSSSRRYKREIAGLGNGAALLEQLRPVAFAWKETGEADIGFVAEEVAAVDPRLVVHEPDGRVEGVRYDRIFTLLVAEAQSQQRQMSDHRTALREAIQAQRERLAALSF